MAIKFNQYTRMFNWATYYFIIVALIMTYVSAYICHTSCKYTSTANGYAKGCSGGANTQCTACDTSYYYLNAGSCTLREDGIFNDSTAIADSNWAQTYSFSDYYSEQAMNYMKLSWTQRAPYSLNLGVSGIYAVRLRVTFIDQTGYTGCRFYVEIGGAYTACSPRQQYAQTLYNLDYWIFTSDLVLRNSTSTTLSLVISRTQSGPTYYTSGNIIDLGFTNVIVLLAKCFEFCDECTSLDLCLTCDSTHYLEYYHKTCETACPASQYEVGTTKVCDPCDQKCISCSVASTNCSLCQQYGPNQSFYYLDQCYTACPNGFIENYDSHVCQCPTDLGYVHVSGTCYTCHPNCATCYGQLDIHCFTCSLGFYLINGTSTCINQCPIGQYQFFLEDFGLCYMCDPNCYECDQNATKCISCSFPPPIIPTYLDNITTDTCVILCPDGYQGNNVTFVCDKCKLGTYSFENKCYSDCPQFYEADDTIRACSLSGGFPLNMTVSIISGEQIAFDILLPLGLRTDSYNELKDNWRNFISIYLINNQNPLTINRRRLQQDRLLQTSALTLGRKITLSSVQVTPNNLRMYTKDVKQTDLILSTQFQVVFANNIYSPNNVMYSVRVIQSTDDDPSVIREYYDHALTLSLYIGVAFFVISVVGFFLGTGLRCKQHLKVITTEFLHNIQIIGLMLFSIYPNSFSPIAYSFLYGLNFSNLDFIPNAPKILMAPCQNLCLSMTSYSFVQGDMDWLRSMGSSLEIFSGFLLISIILYIPQCSRKFSMVFLIAGIQLIILKSVHSWFASFIFVILNYGKSTNQIYVGTHLLSYLLLAPILAIYIKKIVKMTQQDSPMKKYSKYYQLSFIIKLLIVIAIVLLPLAPILICTVILLVVMLECIMFFSCQYGLNLRYEAFIAHQSRTNLSYNETDDTINFSKNNLCRRRKSTQYTTANIKTSDSKMIIDSLPDAQINKIQQNIPNQLIFHKYLLSSVRIFTIISICVITTVSDYDSAVGIISGIMGLLLFMIVVDGCLLHSLYHKEVDNKKDKKVQETIQAFQIKENNNMKQMSTIFKDIDDGQLGDTVGTNFKANNNFRRREKKQHKKQFRVADIQ